MDKSKKTVLVIAVVVIVGIILGFGDMLPFQKEKESIKKQPETEMEKVSYSYGLELAFNFKDQGMDTLIDSDLFCKAFQDVFQNDSLDISKEEGTRILTEYFTKLQQEIMDKKLSANRKLIEEL